METELCALQERCAELNGLIMERQDEVKTLESEVRTLQSSLTDDQAVKELERLQSSVLNLKTKLQNLEENTVQVIHHHLTISERYEVIY